MHTHSKAIHSCYCAVSKQLWHTHTVCWQLTRLKAWLDAQLESHTNLVRFQNKVPLAEVSIVSEARRMIREADLQKLLLHSADVPRSMQNAQSQDCCGQHLNPIHLALFTDCLVLCGIRQNTDKPVNHVLAVCWVSHCWLAGWCAYGSIHERSRMPR